MCDILNQILVKVLLFLKSGEAGGVMYDIHCHIIPYVDDGSGSMIDSVEMASLAVKSGTKGLIATPHCNIPGVFENYWTKWFENKLQELNDELSRREIEIEIYPGQEIFSYNDVVAKLQNGDLITLNNSRYVLLEFDFETPESKAYTATQKLISCGYVPIVAHSERYGFIYENPLSILNFKKNGALIQINAHSLNGSLADIPNKFRNIF